MSPHEHRHGRQARPAVDASLGVRTIDELRSRLHSGIGSFEDWVDGVEVARRAHAWEMLEAAALRALGSARGRPVRDKDLTSAALAVAASTLGSPTTLGDVDRGLQRASSRLRTAADRASTSPDYARSVAVAVRAADAIDENLLLLAQGSSSAMAQVAGWLRREVSRPDAALVVLDHALVMEPGDAACHVSRAAALLDLGKPHTAGASLDRAEALEPGNPYAVRCRIRQLMVVGAPAEALALAEVHLAQSRRVADIALMVAAATQAGDRDHARSLAERFDSAVHDDPKREILILRQAAEQLIVDGYLVEARDLLRDLRQRTSMRQVEVLLRVVNARLHPQEVLFGENRA